MSTRSRTPSVARVSDAPASANASAMTALVSALLVGALCALIAANAHAALYKWTDERGIVHYSDQLPPEAVNRASSELNRQGLTVRKTEQARPVAVERTPKTENEEQLMRQAERDRVIAVRRDRALLESYTDEKEIDLAKSRAVATIEGQVQSAQGLVAQMMKRRDELEGKKGAFAPRPVPGEIAREIETIDDELGRQNEFIAAKKKESAAVAARYDADKLRFRELRNAEPNGVLTSASKLADLKLSSAR